MRKAIIILSILLAVLIIVAAILFFTGRSPSQPDAPTEALLKQAFDSLGMTARSYDRVLRVARTIADLAGSEQIEAAHVAEAVQYRSFRIGEQNL